MSYDLEKLGGSGTKKRLLIISITCGMLVLGLTCCCIIWKNRTKKRGNHIYSYSPGKINVDKSVVSTLRYRINCSVSIHAKMNSHSWIYNSTIMNRPKKISELT